MAVQAKMLERMPAQPKRRRRDAVIERLLAGCLDRAQSIGQHVPFAQAGGQLLFHLISRARGYLGQPKAPNGPQETPLRQ
jgi:hypothetical protein